MIVMLLKEDEFSSFTVIKMLIPKFVTAVTQEKMANSFNDPRHPWQ
jgi:hypothetical protein